jgi:hypothetical protein
MCMRVLNQNGKVVTRSTIRHLTPSEESSEIQKKKRGQFDADIELALGGSVKDDNFQTMKAMILPDMKPMMTILMG